MTERADRLDDAEWEQGVRALVEEAFRADHGKVMAILTRDFGDLQLAEDALQDALLEALVGWSPNRRPHHPTAWIIRVARDRGLDRLRRAATGRHRPRSPTAPGVPVAADGPGTPDEIPDEVRAAIPEDIPDERLGLIISCCDPTLPRDEAVALTLRLVCGWSATEIAAACLVAESTVRARLDRARTTIGRAGVTFRVPDHHELRDRLEPVLDVITLIYRRGHTSAAAGPPAGSSVAGSLAGARVGPVVDRLRAEALDLAGLLGRDLPDEPEVLGCRALLLFQEATSAARVDDTGELVSLPDQDRSRWSQPLIAEGRQLLARARALSRPGPFQLRAAISDSHTADPDAATTDWARIVTLHDRLLAMAPSPTSEIDRAVAIGMAVGPEAGLAALPAPDPPLDRSHRWHGARGDLLADLGRYQEAVRALEWAADLATDPAERRRLRRRANVLAAATLRPDRLS